MEKNEAKKVIDIALAEEGYLEKSKAAYQKDPSVLDRKTDGAGRDNYTKYGRDMNRIYPEVMDFPAYWCDTFVDWCFYKAYGVSNAKKLLGGNFDDYTVASCQLYKNKGALGSTPKEGAQVFFTRNGQVSGCYHTGLGYAADDNYFYTVEGNTSGASGVVSNGGGVAKKKYSISAYKGKVLFGYPPYDKAKSLKREEKKEEKKPAIAKAPPNLKSGSRGEEVKKLQKDLNYAMKSGLDTDGEFGKKTKAALVKFQAKHGLSQDGIYGPKSAKKMKEVIG